jgi:UDP-N-acetylmuramoyl-tripeptide--D-alanyl-D-alanine ligase
VIIAIAGRRGDTARLLLAALLSDVPHEFTTLDATAPEITSIDVVVVLGDEPGLADRLTALPAGTVVYGYADDAAVVSATARIAARLVGFGIGGTADVRADAIESSLTGTTFTTGGARVRVGILGESIVPLALAALAVASDAGVDLDTAVRALDRVDHAARWDMQVSRPTDDIVVINDSADGSPRSTADALKALAQLTIDGTRSVAVLGDLDLAPGTDAIESRDEHDRIGRLVVRLNVSRLIVVGQSARHIHNAAGLEGSWDGESVLVDTADQAYDLLNETELSLHRTTTVVLVKSAASTALGDLGDRIAATGGKRTVIA